MLKTDDTHESLGNYTGLSYHNTGITLQCANGFLDVSFITPQIIKIYASFETQLNKDHHSYAVIAQAYPIEYICEVNDDSVSVRTDKVHIEVSKKPLRVTFLTHNGVILNEDDKAFGVSRAGTEITCYKTLQKDERFIGLGEKNGNLDRRGSYYTHWNTDYFAYPTDGDPLYISTPFYIGVHNHVSYGIFFDNTYKSVIDFGASNNRFASFGAPAGDMTYYFIYGQDVGDIINHYTQLTGRIQLPPLWSLGFQQCRYSYYPQHEVMNLADNFRSRDIPADVIYLDIHYMDSYKAFTWDKTSFPDPDKMIAQLTDMGFHIVLIVDPGVKIDKDYILYNEGNQNNYFITYPDGEPYTGNVWPGECHFPDFTNPAVREWWGSHYKLHIDQGVSGFWNDMNEPSTWGKHIPDLVEFNYEGHTTSHRKAHNVYGMQMARSTYEGTRKQLDNKRPFILTRSGYSGVQRYAAAWTGDNVSTDEHMINGTRLLSSMGLAGMAFCGYDVGGFAGEASPQLYARWIALGAFSPLFRAHSMVNSRDAEPWAFGEETEDIARNYIKLRYRLLPYIYCTFYMATKTGMPVQRSLAIDYTYDPCIYKPAYQNQYLFGNAILVCPVESYKDITTVYLPQGDWYYLFTDKKYKGAEEHYIACAKEHLPVFVKGSSIVPMQADTAHTSVIPDDSTLHLHLYKGQEDNSFLYYEDDGNTFNFEKGTYFKRTIMLTASGHLRLEKAEGHYTSKFTTVRVYYHGFANLKPKANNTVLHLHYMDYSYVHPISHFDPWQQTGINTHTIPHLPFVELPWTTDSLEVFL